MRDHPSSPPETAAPEGRVYDERRERLRGGGCDVRFGELGHAGPCRRHATGPRRGRLPRPLRSAERHQRPVSEPVDQRGRTECRRAAPRCGDDSASTASRRKCLSGPGARDAGVSSESTSAAPRVGARITRVLSGESRDFARKTRTPSTAGDGSPRIRDASGLAASTPRSNEHHDHPPIRPPPVRRTLLRRRFDRRGAGHPALKRGVRRNRPPRSRGLVP